MHNYSCVNIDEQRSKDRTLVIKKQVILWHQAEWKTKATVTGKPFQKPSKCWVHNAIKIGSPQTGVFCQVLSMYTVIHQHLYMLPISLVMTLLMSFAKMFPSYTSFQTQYSKYSYKNVNNFLMWHDNYEY